MFVFEVVFVTLFALVALGLTIQESHARQHREKIRVYRQSHARREGR